MDVDDDDDSPRSLSPSPSSPPPPYSSAVTLAAPSPHANPLTLALPIQPHRSSPSPSVPTAVPTGGGREDAWSEGATSTLIDAWGERFLDLSRGNLKQKHWQEVADAVTSRDDYTKTPKSDVQCKNRIDTLKKKYKLEKSKPFPSTWPFFSRLDLLLGPSHKPSSIPNSDTYHESKIAPNPLPPRKAAAFPMATKRSRSVTSSEEENTPAEIRNSDPYHVPRMSRNPLPPRKAAAFAALGKRSRSRSASSGEENMNIPADSDNGKSSSEEEDGLPPEPERKRRIEGLRELTRAIVKFGEVYERVESSKIQQAVEMEKQRMGFARELELQRMQFFMKTQMELSQLKRRHHHHHRRDGSRRRSGGAVGGVGGGSSNNHHRHHHHREDGNNDNGNGGIE